MKSLARYLQQIWYQAEPPLGLRLLSVGFRALVWLRRKLYSLRRAEPNPISVVIVGNLTVGGNGKTPLVIYLCQLLQAAGYRVGIISRGYGGREKGPLLVGPHHGPHEVGDEPRLISDRTQCPLVVGRNRVRALQHLCRLYQLDVVLSDDGLQHYALQRQLEVVLIGGQRFGNAHLLPAGPLREPISRLKSVDFILSPKPEPGWYTLSIEAQAVYELTTLQRRALSEFKGQTVHAVAGIAHPQGFFELLRQAGLHVIEHPFPDHHVFREQDLNFSLQYPVLMTEKEVNKCALILQQAPSEVEYWVVPIDYRLPETFDRAFFAALKLPPPKLASL